MTVSFFIFTQILIFKVKKFPTIIFYILLIGKKRRVNYYGRLKLLVLFYCALKEPLKCSSILDFSLRDKLNLKHALYEFWKWKVFDGIFISPSISLNKFIQCIYDNLLFIQMRLPSFQHLFVSPLDRTFINTFSFFCYCVKPLNFLK